MPFRARDPPIGDRDQVVGTDAREPLDLLTRQADRRPGLIGVAPGAKTLYETGVGIRQFKPYPGDGRIVLRHRFPDRDDPPFQTDRLVRTAERLLDAGAVPERDRQESTVLQILRRLGERLLGLLGPSPVERQRLLALAYLLKENADVIQAGTQIPAPEGIVGIERDEHLADRQRFLISVQHLHLVNWTLLGDAQCVVGIGQLALESGVPGLDQALPDRDRLFASPLANKGISR